MSYKVNDREYSFDSYTNQKIVSRFVSEEINVCVTSVAEFIIKVTSEGMPYMDIESEAPFTYNDIENQYVDNTDEIDELQEQVDEMQEKLDELQEKRDELEEQLDEIRDEYESDPAHSELLRDISECEYEIKTLEDKIDKLENKIDKLDDKISELDDKISELQTEDGDFKEVCEWWDVSPWLCNRLEEYGEVVIPSMGYWGRQTTGQSISLDYVISEICYNMEILEGQERSWEEYVK